MIQWAPGGQFQRHAILQVQRHRYWPANGSLNICAATTACSSARCSIGPGSGYSSFRFSTSPHRSFFSHPIHRMSTLIGVRQRKKSRCMTAQWQPRPECSIAARYTRQCSAMIEIIHCRSKRLSNRASGWCGVFIGSWHRDPSERSDRNIRERWCRIDMTTQFHPSCTPA